MLKAHIGEMASNSSGFFIADVNGTEEVVAYETMPATGWVTVVSVPADFVFAGINKLRMVYRCAQHGRTLMGESPSPALIAGMA